MNNIYNITREELEEFFINNNETRFRAIHTFEWIYKKRLKSFEEIGNISKNTIEKLSNNLSFYTIKIIKIEKSKEVNKYLFELEDGNNIESVLMFHDYGISLCISTQVGCSMGCSFCESGRYGKTRNLYTYEMVQQIIEIEKDIDKRITHVVLMGIGEPFDNYDNVMKFIRIINDPKGIEIGARHITLSTCGIIPKIKDFGNEGLQVNLAISLHAPNDELRNKLMPINKVYPIKELIESIKEYINKTNRRVTFEYVMIKGINDTKECALELSKLIKGINCYVNLIPYNDNNYDGYESSSDCEIMSFYDILKCEEINVTIRKKFGDTITAACGQLRSKNMEEL